MLYCLCFQHRAGLRRPDAHMAHMATGRFPVSSSPEFTPRYGGTIAATRSYSPSLPQRLLEEKKK